MISVYIDPGEFGTRLHAGRVEGTASSGLELVFMQPEQSWNIRSTSSGRRTKQVGTNIQSGIEIRKDDL